MRVFVKDIDNDLMDLAMVKSINEILRKQAIAEFEEDKPTLEN